jgi:uncharacterized protein (DUF1015 family)
VGCVGQFKPFRALRYDERAAGRLDDLVAPPHDVITPELRARLLAASPYNCVRLIGPEAPEEAALYFEEWKARGVLVREERPAVWRLAEDFVGPDGLPRRRTSLVARVRLEPYREGAVLPHERTLAKAKAARLELLRALRTKLSPVLLLHEGAPPELPAGDPHVASTFGGVRSSLWRIDDPAAVERALAALRGRILIADGHHRYETALRFHEEEGSEETAYILAALVSRDDPGLVIFPTHRLTGGPLPELNGRFRLTSLDGGAAEAFERLGLVPRDRPAFVLLRPGATTLVEGEPESGPLAALDTAVIDGLPLAGVRFTPSVADAEAEVTSGRAAAAFLVRPPTIDQVEAVALAGEKMPEKSTYFFPKLTSGLLFSPFDE